eukprot:2386151-Pyramimonas_sp.AAC.1
MGRIEASSGAAAGLLRKLRLVTRPSWAASSSSRTPSSLSSPTRSAGASRGSGREATGDPAT